MGGILLAVLAGTWLVDESVTIGQALADRAEPLAIALRYHEIADQPNGAAEAVSPAELCAHVRALKETGWQFATVSQLTALAGTPDRFPPRVALLTFDEGLASFYHEVLPLLREEQVPATLAVSPGRIGRRSAESPEFLTWEQLVEIAQSGWVEIASETHGLHAQVTGDARGKQAGAIASRLFLVEQGRLEDGEDYAARIGVDLALSKRQLEERLGIRVRVLAWPRGEHNRTAREIARATGFAATLTLEGSPVGSQDLRDGLIPRLAVHRGDRVGDPNLVEWIRPGPDSPGAALSQ